jgi:uncharacterized protein YbaR (Trm112 family)
MTLQSLLELIRCPRCKSPLVHDGDWLISSDPSCRLKYEIKNDIPVLIPEEAVEVSREEWSDIMGRHSRDRSSGVLLSTGNFE